MSYIRVKKDISKEELQKIVDQLEVGPWTTTNDVDISEVDDDEFIEDESIKVDTNSDEIEDENIEDEK
jgi:hypothetical protein